jgi:hypothetical protein
MPGTDPSIAVLGLASKQFGRPTMNTGELERLRRRIVTLLTVGIWIGIFIAGLWPFDFVPKNRIRWLPRAEGLQFDGYGQVYSSVPMFPSSGSDEAAKATVELVLTPEKPYNTASTVFSLINQDEVSFAIGQSLTDLFLQGSFTQRGGNSVAKLWLDQVCGRAQELFVTVTLDSRHIDVYLDGRLANSFPVSTRADNLSGKVLVGHSVKGTGYWSGSVARLAILEGTLDALEITQRYEQWATIRHLDKDMNHPGVAYEFVTPATDFVRNLGETGPDLMIPTTFRLTKYNVLEWPEHFDRSVATDGVVNIAGFIPFGLLTCLCLRCWTGWSIPRCLATTILAGASVSLAIELLQVLLPTRDSSLADLVTNILGATIGAGVTTTSK